MGSDVMGADVPGTDLERGDPPSSIRAGRPLVGLCVAVVTGSLLGSLFALPWAGLALVGCASWIVALAFERPTRAERAGGSTAGVAPVGTFGSRVDVPRLVLLVACAAVAGWRASDEAARAAARAADATSSPIGAWNPARTEREERVRVEGRAFAAPIGLVAPGETVVLAPGGLPRELPRGPEPGPRATSPSPSAAAFGSTDLEPDEIVRVARADPGVFARADAAVDALRDELVERARGLCDPETRGLVLALLFGDTSALPEGLPDLFVRTGTYHILAVSGMQVVLVVLFLIVPLARATSSALRAATRGRVRVSHEVFALVMLVLFVPIAGGGAPVVRSALGAGFALVAWNVRARRAAVVEVASSTARTWLSRRADSVSCWSLALTLECVLHPDAPLSLSVQLSYAATLGLIVGTGPFLVVLRSCVGRPAIAPITRLGRERSPWWRIPAERAIAAFLTAVAASLAAVLATLPFTWSRLGEWSPIGVLATPALGPSMTVLLALGWLHVLTGGLVPEAALQPFARAMSASMRAFDVLPFTPTGLPPRPLAWVMAACVLTFVALALARTPTQHIAWLPRVLHAPGRVARCAALTWAVVIVPWSATPARVEVHALDVGAGTAVVIDGPGIGTWVFDAGSRDRRDVAREAVGPLLRRIDPGRIGIVLSHEDEDHDGALPWVVERFDVDAFAGARPARIDERLSHTCARLDVDPGRALLPSLHGDCALVQAFVERASIVDGNEGSRAVRLVVAGETALLCGDAEAEGLSAWIAAFGIPRVTTRVDDRGERRGGGDDGMRFVLWPHHGSDTDRLAPFLAATRPREVWLSASGLPPVHSELARRGIATKCTSRDGPLSATMPSGTLPAALKSP